MGAALLLLQWSGSRSFSLDELAVALNLRERTLLDLLGRPLDFDQVAPVGFLAVERLVGLVSAFGERELRILPLLASLASLWLFRRVAAPLLDDAGRLAAMLLFATAAPLVFRGADLKPYSLDVLATLLLLDRFLANDAAGPKGARSTLAVVVFCVVFSLAAVPVLGTLGLACGLRGLARGPGPSRFAALRIGALHLAGAFLGALLARRGLAVESRTFLAGAWSHGFPPDGGLELSGWLASRLTSFFATDPLQGLGYPLPGLAALAASAGLVRLLLKHGLGGLAAATPLLAATLAAYLGQYPLSGRVSSFVLPTLLLGLGSAIEAVTGVLAGRPGARIALALACCVPGALPVARSLPPWSFEDTRPVLAWLRREWRADDVAYVYYGAAPAVSFYAALPPEASALWGQCHRDDPRAYLRELDSWRGRPRVWFVASHALPPREVRDLLRYLETIGRRIDHRVSVPRLPAAGLTGAAVHLFDLSDPERLQAASDKTFPLTPPADRDLRECVFGPIGYAAHRANIRPFREESP